MDKREDSKEASEDQVRESLIEISNCLPDKVQNPDVSEDGVVVVNGDEADKYRSELISISYSESPDLALSPAARS